MHNKKDVCLFFLFLTTLHFIFAQEESPYASVPRSIKIYWTGVEYVWRYSVEIEKKENGVYKKFLQRFTTTPYLNLSILPGVYRYRIIPHDILDRPREGTVWIDFEIHNALIYNKDNSPVVYNGDEINRDQIFNFDIDDLKKGLEKHAEERERVTSSTEQQTTDIEQLTEKDDQLPTNELEKRDNDVKKLPKFNTIGVSAGTAFTDPLVSFTLHGTYSPINNFFIELGCDVGFISIHDDVDNFYSIYPYLNLGYFLPFKSKGGFFASAGAGYIIGSYKFSHGGTTDLNYFSANITAGVNIINAINISYTFKTDFTAVSHQIAVGYVYRFIQRKLVYEEI